MSTSPWSGFLIARPFAANLLEPDQPLRDRLQELNLVYAPISTHERDARPPGSAESNIKAASCLWRWLSLSEMPYLLPRWCWGLPWMRFVPMISILVSLRLTVRSVLRSRAALQLEVRALRHQLQVLHRSRPRRVRLAHVDRL